MSDIVRTSTFRDYLKVIYRYKIIFVLLLAVVLPSSYYKFQRITPMHRASVTMMIKAQKGTEAAYYQGIALGKSLNLDLATLVTSNVVLERVVEALKLYDYPLDYEKQFATPYKARKIEERSKKREQRLKERGIVITPERRKQAGFNSAMGWLNTSVAAWPSEESSMFEITATDYDPQRALLVANSVSRSYVIFDLEQQIVELRLKYGDKHSTVLQLKKYIDDFTKTLDGKLIPDLEAIGPASVKIIRQARTTIPIRYINKQRNYIILFFICLLATIVIAFGLEFLNQSIRTPLDVEADLGLTCLGSIVKKKYKNRIFPIIGRSDNMEYNRTLNAVADNIYMSMKENNTKSLLITDIDEAKDSSEVVTNLGYYFSEQQGLRVLIIDANLRKNNISSMLSIDNGHVGLSDIISGESSFMEATVELSPQLHILTSGKTIANPVPFLQSDHLADIISEAKKNYDIVFVNSAELRNYGDSIIISASVDGLVLFLSEGETKKVIGKNAVEQLKQKDANIVGVVLNNRKYVLPKLLYKIT